MQQKSIFTFLWYHIKPYKWYYLVMLLGPITSAFYPFVYNYSIKLFLDTMSQSTTLTYKSILYPIFLFILAYFVTEIIWKISNISEWKSEPYVRRSILMKSYDYVQHHSYSFFQDNFTGAISSKIKGLLDGYDKFWGEMTHGMLEKFLVIIVNLSALIFVNFYLGLFLLTWTSIYMPTIYKLSKHLSKLANNDSECTHSIIGNVSDKITNIMTLFAFSSRKRELESLDNQITNDFIPKQIELYKYDFKLQIIASILYGFLFIFILFYMIYLKKHGIITIGDFAFVFVLTASVAQNIWDITRSMQDFARSMGNLKSALSVVRVPHTHLDLKDAKKLMIRNPGIEFNNVSFAYNKDQFIFKDLNLKIKSGEKVGLVGHTGAGKSTLINILLKYFPINSGEILIDEQRSSDLTQDSIRENIAVIPQDTMLFHRTLMENIRYGDPNASDKEVMRASKKAHIDAFIKTLPDKYNTYVGERGIKLSGGQRQRIAIARAILKDAPILILDEATSSLDSVTEKLIQDSLNTLIKDKKKTVIAIAHRLSTLKHMDRIVVLEHGNIIEEGTHNELLKRKDSLYKKLWEHQEI